MVQKARLDLSVSAALALALLASPALAQDGPLTTLMRPQPLSTPSPLGRSGGLTRTERLFGEDPLASVDALSGTGSLSNQRPAGRPAAAGPAKPGQAASACDRRATSRRGPAFGLASGGSGPGEYSRFVDNGRGADAKPPASPARTPSGRPGDQPLYGGTDRALWSDGTPSPAPRNDSRARMASDTRQRPASGSDALAAPTAGFDRPLWADAGPLPAAPEPCETRREGKPQTQTLFFGSGPAR